MNPETLKEIGDLLLAIVDTSGKLAEIVAAQREIGNLRQEQILDLKRRVEVLESAAASKGTPSL